MRSLVALGFVALIAALVGGYAVTRQDHETAATVDCVARGEQWIRGHLPAERRRLRALIRREQNPAHRRAYLTALRVTDRMSAAAAEYACSGGSAITPSAPVWMR